jgi:hypothetical protein
MAGVGMAPAPVGYSMITGRADLCLFADLWLSTADWFCW